MLDPKYCECGARLKGSSYRVGSCPLCNNYKNDRTCSKCHEYKSINLFYLKGKSRSSICIKCENKISYSKRPIGYAHKAYIKHKEYYRKYHLQWLKNHPGYEKEHNKKFKESRNKINKTHQDNLSDYYIKKIIKRRNPILKNVEIPKEIIDVHRSVLKIKRFFYQQKGIAS